MRIKLTRTLNIFLLIAFGWLFLVQPLLSHHRHTNTSGHQEYSAQENDLGILAACFELSKEETDADEADFDKTFSVFNANFNVVLFLFSAAERTTHHNQHTSHQAVQQLPLFILNNTFLI